MMKELISSFSKQLSEAIAIGEKAVFSPPGRLQNVIISGLGGSGIGGTIVSELLAGKATVPLCVNKDYFLPAYAGPETLVIISSYSGNTEETISAMQTAVARKARVVCVTSGGTIAELARQHQTDLILIPGGMPPRACLAYSFTQLFYVLHHFGIIGPEFQPDIREAIAFIDQEEASIQLEAEKLASFLHQRVPVIYSATGSEGVSVRFRQQLNENAKMLCWHHVIPEMNHNELVGWREKNNTIAVVMFRSREDYSRTQKRMEICKGIILQYTPHFMEVWAKGASPLARDLYLIHLGDWASCFLADKKQIDAMEVNVINHLKSSLAAG